MRNFFTLGGKEPFGWRATDDGDLVEQAAEQNAIRGMAAMHAAGCSLRAIAATMRERGFAVSHVTVRSILSSYDK